MQKRKQEFNLTNAIECSACTCFNTRKFTRVITQIFDEQFKTVDFRITQFTPLVMIFAKGPITINDLSENLVMDRTTLARNLKPLERDSLININTGIDKRQRVVSITDKGKTLLNRAFPIWQKAQEKILKEIGDNKWQDMLRDIHELLPKLQNLV